MSDIRFVEFVVKARSKKLSHNQPSIVRVRGEPDDEYPQGELYSIKVYYIPWTTRDNRYIVVDVYKSLFGFPRLGVNHIPGLRDGLLGRYDETDRPLAEFDPDKVHPKAMDSIRATLAFRIAMGMRSNNEHTVVIRNRLPLSKRDVFWAYHKLECGGKAKVADSTYKRWFADNSDPTSYIKKFPIWRDLSDEDRLDLFDDVRESMLDIALYYDCICLYNYAIRMIRRALLVDSQPEPDIGLVDSQLEASQ